jgi:hypothetical protein
VYCTETFEDLPQAPFPTDHSPAVSGAQGFLGVYVQGASGSSSVGPRSFVGANEPAYCYCKDCLARRSVDD